LIAVAAFLIVAEPPTPEPPNCIMLAAPKTLALVTVVLSKLNVVAVLVIVPPFANILATKVASLVTERVLLVEIAP
jgi:hypothetical protein